MLGSLTFRRIHRRNDKRELLSWQASASKACIVGVPGGDRSSLGWLRSGSGAPWVLWVQCPVRTVPADKPPRPPRRVEDSTRIDVVRVRPGQPKRRTRRNERTWRRRPSSQLVSATMPSAGLSTRTHPSSPLRACVSFYPARVACSHWTHNSILTPVGKSTGTQRRVNFHVIPCAVVHDRRWMKTTRVVSKAALKKLYGQRAGLIWPPRCGGRVIRRS